jgi:O-antigen/teichoic acid export membrane protein
MTIASSSREGFAFSVAATFAAKLAAAVLGLPISIVIARSLGPEGRGAFAAVVTLAGIGMSLANLGLHSSNTYFLSRDKALLAPIVANSILVSLVCGTLAAVMLAAVAWWIGTDRTAGQGLIAVALCGVPIGLAYMLLVNLLIALSSVARFNQIELGLKLTTLLLTLAVVVVFTADPAEFLIAALLAQVVALVALWFSLGQNLACSISAVSMDLLRKQLPFALRAYLASFLGYLMMRSDILLVQHIAGNEEAGQYAIAVAMADFLYMLPAAAGLLLFPKLSATTEGQARRRATWKLLAGIGLVMSAMGLMAALIAAPAISVLFGPRFLPAAPLFHVLAVAMVFNGMNNIVSNHLAAEGLPWVGVWVWAVGLGISVVLNLLWIPALGARGAALAAIVAYAVVLLIQSLFAFRPKETNR